MTIWLALSSLLILQTYVAHGVRQRNTLFQKSSPEEESAHLGPSEPAELPLYNNRGARDAVLGSEEAPEQDTEPKGDPEDDVRIHFEVKTLGHVRAVSATMKGRRPTEEDVICHI